MAFLSSMDIVGSGLTAQQLRLDVISENITNIKTTRTENGGAYRRKMVVFQAKEGRDTFRNALAKAKNGLASNRGYSSSGGVEVTGIVEDNSDLKLVYDPTNPDANQNGYVEMPNVTLVQEIADAMSATQAFSANVTTMNVIKTVASKGLEIGI